MKRGSRGFTLVELIVVIAVMGILAAVGALAYNGYVNAAKKGMDRRTVGDLIKAAELADLANPGLLHDGSTAVIALTANGVQVLPEGLGQYIADAVGELDGVSLQYEKWSGTVDEAVLANAISKVSAIDGGKLKAALDGGASASYAGDMPALWDDVVRYSTLYADAFKDNPNWNSRGDFLAAIGEKAGANGDGILQSWSDGKSFADRNIGLNNQVFAAFEMARNYSFAEYLVNNGYQVSDKAIAALKSENAAFLGIYRGIATNNQTAATFFSAGDLSAMRSAAAAYSDGSGGGPSQLYLDGAGFISVMQTVNDATNAEGAKYNKKDDSYLDEMGSYAALCGAALSGSDSGLELAELSKLTLGASSIVITAGKSGDRVTCSVSPADADPREKPAEAEEEETVTLSFRDVTVDRGNVGSASATVTSSTEGKKNLGYFDSVVFTAADPAIVEVSVAANKSGASVTGRKAGSTTVYVTATKGGKVCEASFTATVNEVANEFDLSFSISMNAAVDNKDKTKINLTPKITAAPSKITLSAKEDNSIKLSISLGDGLTLVGDTLTYTRHDDDFGEIVATWSWKLDGGSWDAGIGRLELHYSDLEDDEEDIKAGEVDPEIYVKLKLTAKSVTGVADGKTATQGVDAEEITCTVNDYFD